jgi:hypothetical protein
MVRANGANTNAEIHAPLSSYPQVRRSRFNAPSPAPGCGMRCAPAPGPAEGTRAGLGGAARASPARIPRRGRGAALTRSEAADRSSADTGEPRRRVNNLPPQGPRAKISGEDK